MEISSLPPERLLPFIDRVRKFDIGAYETYLHNLLVSVLSELGEFVPSEGAVVLVDEPNPKNEDRSVRELIYIAAMGASIQQLPGKRTRSSSGVLGEIYTLGKSMVRKPDRSERMVIDKTNLPREIQSLIAVPLKIESSVIGALLAFNKREPVGYTLRDLKLLEIFGGYLSMSLQNAVDSHKARELSKRDDLTGLFNDRYFHRQLEIEIVKAEEKRTPLTLLFLDLDNFKSVNDQYGHLVGSRTLKEIGFVLRDTIDYPTASLARYGGDEYVAILPAIELEPAVETAERVRMGIVGKLFMIDCGEQDGSFINFKGILSASIGVASYHHHVPKGGSTKEGKNLFLRLADQAMYKAKELGKNRVCVADPSWLKAK